MGNTSLLTTGRGHITRVGALSSCQINFVHISFKGKAPLALWLRMGVRRGLLLSMSGTVAVKSQDNIDNQTKPTATLSQDRQHLPRALPHRARLHFPLESLS